MSITRTSTEILHDVAGLLGVSSDVAAQVFDGYYSMHPAQVPAGTSWQDVAAVFEQMPGVPHGGPAALTDYLRTQVTAGPAEYPSEVLDDPQLRAAFAHVAAPGAGVPVVEGGAVLQYADEYYLGETQLWLARDAAGDYFYDRAQQIYDLSGRPEAPKAPASPGGRIAARDGRFYLDGATEVWRAVDADGAYYYDADNRIFDEWGEPIPVAKEAEADRLVLSVDHPVIAQMGANIAEAIRTVEGFELLTAADLLRILERELADFR